MEIIKIVLEIIGGISIIIAILIGLKKLIKRERLTVQVTNFSIVSNEDENEKPIKDELKVNVYLTFNNCGNKQAGILGVDFDYDLEKDSFNIFQGFHDTYDGKVPKIIKKGDTMVYTFTDVVPLQMLRMWQEGKISPDNIECKELYIIGLNVRAIDSKGKFYSRSFEFVELNVNGGNYIYLYNYKICEFEIDIFKNRIRKLKKGNPNLNRSHEIAI